MIVGAVNALNFMSIFISRQPNRLSVVEDGVDGAPQLVSRLMTLR